MRILLDRIADILDPVIHVADHHVEFIQCIRTPFNCIDLFHRMLLLELRLLLASLLICFLRNAIFGGLHLQLAQACRNIFAKIHTGRLSECKQFFTDMITLFSRRITFGGTCL